ncbi:MAG: sigma-70 family RNA polymerase sigma factor [Solirubrobacterales bacterium]
MNASTQDERLLLRQFAASRDPRIRDELVDRFMPLARSLALRFRGGIESVEDLVQVASLGLLKALDRYEPARNVDFVAYAAPTILGELRHHFRDHSWTVRLPRGLQERSMRIDEVVHALNGESGRSPTVSEIASRAALTETEVLEALYADRTRRPMSLDAASMRIEDDPTPLVETIGTDEPAYGRIEDDLAAATAPLRPRERQALHLRFHEGLTQREIGARIGISQMQVSRTLNGALRKLLAAVGGGEELPEPA